MLLATSVNFESIRTLLIGGGLLLIVALVARLRRPAVPRSTHFLVGVGLVLLCLAAGGLTLDRPLVGQVTVMVDRSASTRTARYRDANALRARTDQLLGKTSYRIVPFAQLTQPAMELEGAHLEDLPGDRTLFDPPGAGPVVLFSDGQFSIPHQLRGAVYAVIDPQLESTDDASVKGIEIRANEVAVSVANRGASRNLTMSGASTASPDVVVPAANIVISKPLVPNARRISATFEKGDAWPENDSLSAIVPPSPTGERWWIGAAPPDAGWRAIEPKNFPTDPAALLSPSIIVLNNVAAAGLSISQQERLRQYVRDFGGGLVILGGDHAFAAGGYAGSVLETLSPLASTPPKPTSQWLLLTDSSGSMASDAGVGSTRWKAAVDAIANVLPALPPADRVSIGGFARDLTWWVRDAAAKDVSPDRFPPPGAAPRGPTMLADALRNIAKSVDDGSTLPSQLLLMTDAGATIDKPAEIAAMLHAKKIHVHVLIIGDEDGAGLAALRQIVSATNGTMMTELNAQKWTAAAKELTRAAMPNLLRRDPLTATFSDALKSLPPARLELWNRTWLKEAAAPLAHGSAGNEQFAPVARAIGDEHIIAAAFSPTAGQVDAFVKIVERPPRDPRFKTTWDIGSKIHLTIDAVDSDGRYMNGRKLSATWVNDRDELEVSQTSLPQTGPGRYEWTADPPREPVVVKISFADGGVEYRSIPGRYPVEFDAIGNDRPTMNDLATRTGGRVIEPWDSKPIDFNWPTKRTPLASLLAVIGAAMIAAGLAWWRVS